MVDNHAIRLRKIMTSTGLTGPQLGEVLGASNWSVSKLLAGRTRWSPLRLLVLEALERALARATPAEVWGNLAGVSPLDRLARIFSIAHRDALPSLESSRHGPVQLRPRRGEGHRGSL